MVMLRLVDWVVAVLVGGGRGGSEERDVRKDCSFNFCVSLL